MKVSLAVPLLSALLLAGCAVKSHPCKVTPPPTIQKPAEAPAPAVVVAPTSAPVPAPPAAIPAPPAPAPNYAALFNANVNDVFFDFDKSGLRSDAQTTLAANVIFLKKYPNIQFKITSSCDVVGTSQYNKGLGQRRLKTVSSALTTAGIDPTRFNGLSLGKTDSYGKGRQLNRRVHFEYAGSK